MGQPYQDGGWGPGVKKRDRFSERLEDWRKLFENLREFQFRSPDNFQMIERWFETVASQRNGATTEPTLFLAATFFGLDMARERDAALLLRILADIVFHSRRKGRRKGSKKWDPNELIMLGIRADAAGSVEKLGSHYSHITTDAIRRQMPSARQACDHLDELITSRLKETGLSPEEYFEKIVREMSPDELDELKRQIQDLHDLSGGKK